MLTERIETTKLNRGMKQVLERIKQGDSFILTRYGKDVAYLTAPPKDDLIEEDTKTTWITNPSARDELLNRIRSKKGSTDV